MVLRNPTPYAVLIELASLQSSTVGRIKCLYAARNTPSASPHMRAYASFWAAQILINEYFMSESALGEAKTLLLSAERDLTSSQHSNANAGYLATLSLLGQCHMLLGDDTSAAAVFQSGVRVAASGGSSSAGQTSASPAHALAQWQAHFLLFLARVEGGSQHGRKKVSEHLKAVEALNIEDPVYRTGLALSQAISAMQSGDTVLADQHLTTTATELAGALRRSNSSNSHFVESLRAHYYLLYALNAHMGGRTAHLSSEGTYPAYEEFFKAVERLDKLEEDRQRDKETNKAASTPGALDGDFPPLDDADLKACGEMMYENVLRMAGDSSSGINSGNKGKPAEQTARCVQFLEYEATKALTVCDFQLAAKTLLEAVREDRRDPDGRSKSASLTLLLAQYFHSTREYDAALGLLSTRRDDPRAAPLAALVELERNDIHGAISRMASLKDAVNIDALPAHERAVVQMVNGLILLRQDDSTGARLMLTKALKQAHSMVGSGQFVGQILNCLAPVQQMHQDFSGALQMLESSATLLKSAKDLMSLVTTLVGMEKLYLAMKQEDKAASCRQYLEKKNAELNKRLQSVYCSGAHKELLRLSST